LFVFSNNSIIAKAYPYFKWSVYFLLFINMILFFKTRTIVEGIESLAWLILLIMFEWETAQLNKPYISVHKNRMIFVLTIIAYIFIIYSAYYYMIPEYIKKNGKLDMYNTITWLLVVILIEYDVYFPGKYYRLEWIIRNILKKILYCILFIVAVLWLINGEFFNFYDAFLWIICFFFIELNILRFEEKKKFKAQ